MNILFVHETEYIEKVVFEYQVIPEILASSGHNVWVIDFPSNWKKKSFFDFGSLKTTYLYNVKKANKKNGITLIRPGFLKIPVVSRLMAFVAYWWVIPRTIKRHKIDCIVLYSVPTNGLQTILWSKVLKVPLFFRLFDVLHQIVPFKILKGITYGLEKVVYRHVDAFAATTPKLTEYGVAMGAPKDHSFYLPTGSDLDLFSPKPKDETLMKQYGFELSDTVICFAGTLYNFSGLDHLISYLAKKPADLEKVKLLICGNGEQESSLRELIKRSGLEKQVILTGLIQYNQLAKYMNLSDVCINLFTINNLTADIIPGKIYQYLACRKPVISTRLPGMLDVYPENGDGHPVFYCDEADPKQFFALVQRVIGRSLPDTDLSLQQIAVKYEETIRRLVAEERHD